MFAAFTLATLYIFSQFCHSQIFKSPDSPLNTLFQRAFSKFTNLLEKTSQMGYFFATLNFTLDAQLVILRKLKECCMI